MIKRKLHYLYFGLEYSSFSVVLNKQVEDN